MRTRRETRMRVARRLHTSSRTSHIFASPTRSIRRHQKRSATTKKAFRFAFCSRICNASRFVLRFCALVFLFFFCCYTFFSVIAQLCRRDSSSRRDQHDYCLERSECRLRANHAPNRGCHLTTTTVNNQNFKIDLKLKKFYLLEQTFYENKGADQ